MHEDSCIGITYAHMFPKCFRSLHTIVGFRSVLHVVNAIVVAVTIYSILTCTRFPCRDSHCENGSFEVLSLHRIRLQIEQLRHHCESIDPLDDTCDAR